MESVTGASASDELDLAPCRRRDVIDVVQDGQALLYEPDGRTHRLDGLATVLWQCLDGSVTLRELACDLQDALGTDATAAEQKLLGHVGALREAGLLSSRATPPRSLPAVEPLDGGVEPAADGPELVAYRLAPGRDLPLVPGPGRRGWMDATVDRFAYRCLPLKVANESGWVLESEHTVLATWDGGPSLHSLEVTCLRGHAPCPAVSHFGHGILTWSLPYLFRTSPGWNLLMRGPANWPKDGASPLEGLIETDWTAATATMNWKLTRPGLTVRFDVGDPIAMLVPTRRGELEGVRPRFAELTDDTELAGRHRIWSASRMTFIGELPERTGAKSGELWEKHYMRGRDPDGQQAPEHQRKRVLQPFRPEDR
jgi:hypothetical protein